MTPELTVSGMLIKPRSEGGIELGEGTIRIKGDRIVSIDARMTSRPDLGGPGYLISPGFVDAHLHLPQFDSIGVAGLELLDWLETVIFPAEARWGDTGFAREMSRRVGHQLLRAGTTSIAAYATSHAAATQAAADVLGGLGFSGHVGHVLMDQNGPSNLLVEADKAIADCRGLLAAGRVQPSINPRFAVACSMELMQAAAGLAGDTGWRIQTHLAETIAEIETVRRIYGMGYVETYDRAGLLRAGALFAHGIHLSADDRSRLEGRGCIIAHCPTANRFLRAGSMNWDATAASGVRVALGSDVAGGPDRCMVRVARGMLENSGGGTGPTKTGPDRTGPTAMAGRAWWHITRGNAECLGVPDVGRLEVGARADILVLQPDLSLALADPLGTVIHGWDDRWLQAVIIGGRRYSLTDPRPDHPPTPPELRYPPGFNAGTAAPTPPTPPPISSPDPLPERGNA